MTHRIKAELDVCQGFGNCVVNAPDLFDLDDDDVVVVLRDLVDDAERAHAEHAARSCPVSALTIEAE